MLRREGRVVRHALLREDEGVYDPAVPRLALCPALVVEEARGLVGELAIEVGIVEVGHGGDIGGLEGEVAERDRVWHSVRRCASEENERVQDG